jgi:hypothetical protein
MARQENTCWRCGTQWASEVEPRPALRVIAGGSDARLDAERWANEGGSIAVSAVAARRP